MNLHPVAKQMIDEAKESGQPNAHLLPISEARTNFEATFAALEKPPVARVEDLSIEVRDAVIPGRLFSASMEAKSQPVVVYFHGGGWLLGSVDSHDVVTRRLALASGCAVVSVGYRRGPEARFPIAVNDAVDAVCWVHANAEALGLDPERIAVAGDSAGGNLATVAARLLGTDDAPDIAHQLLAYPVTTCDLDRGFDPDYEGIMLYRDELQWHQDNYLPSPNEAGNPDASPLLARLEGLPSATVIVAECDPIRPQGELYADALHEAGVPVESYQADTLIHGFFGLDEVFPEASEAMTLAGRRLKEAFALQPEAN